MSTTEQRCKRQEAPRWLLLACYSRRERYHYNHFRHYWCLPAGQQGDDDAATAYSHDHTLSLGSFTGREEQGHRVSHFPYKWLPLKVFHVFTIYSLVPIRRLVPRENRSICSSPKSPSG